MYLDARGLVALWREGLLAQAVLRGRTKGYTHHPQLARFRAQQSPLACIAEYLRIVENEAQSRGYQFAPGKINRARTSTRLAVTRGQLAYEWDHLMRKLKSRDPARYRQLRKVKSPRAHPLFQVVQGGVAEWEKVIAPASRKRAVRRRKNQDRK